MNNPDPKAVADRLDNMNMSQFANENDYIGELQALANEAAAEIERLQAHIANAPQPSADMSADDVLMFLNAYNEWKDNG